MKFLRYLVIAAVFFSGKVFAEDRTSNSGIKVEFLLGIPQVSITNTDDTVARYSGISTQAKAFMPLLTWERVRFDLTGSFKYLDVKNSFSSSQTESAQYIGPGLGFEFSAYRFFVGTDMFYLRGRHSAVGPISKYSEYDISGLSVNFGARIVFGTAGVGAGISRMNSSIPSTKSGLSKDAPWIDQIYWLQFTYNFNAGAGQMLKSLFGI